MCKYINFYADVMSKRVYIVNVYWYIGGHVGKMVFTLFMQVLT